MNKAKYNEYILITIYIIGIDYNFYHSWDYFKNMFPISSQIILTFFITKLFFIFFYLLVFSLSIFM